jgi:hypothetical protein
MPVLSKLTSQFRGSVTKPIPFHYLPLPFHQPFWWSVHTLKPQCSNNRNTCRPSRVMNTQLEFVLMGHWANVGSNNCISNSWLSLQSSDGISDILSQVSLKRLHALQTNFWIQPQIQPRTTNVNHLLINFPLSTLGFDVTDFWIMLT